MYVGHFATGLLIKALCPTVPSAPIIYGIGILDILNGLSTIVGLNSVRPNLNAGPYLFFDLVFIDWDHSLVMATVLSILWGLGCMQVYRERQFPTNKPPNPDNQGAGGGAVGVVGAAAAFSHWLCDLPFHNLDLAAYPYSIEHFGWSWYAKYGTTSWFMEGAFTAACLAVTAVLFSQRGVSIKGPLVVCLGLFLNLSPWASPMYYVAQLPPPYDYLVHGFLVTLGFTTPAWILVRMLDGAEDRARGAEDKKTM